MNQKSQKILNQYLSYCKGQKCLDQKTLRAYQSDLTQFLDRFPQQAPDQITVSGFEAFIQQLHCLYKPRTAKRKIASLKAFYHHLEYREILVQNPFQKIRTQFREPQVLPKTIPLRTVERLLRTIHQQRFSASTVYRRRNAVRDAAVCELLFATGIRISELCSLRPCDVNLADAIILIHGKGLKERRIQIGSPKVLEALMVYRTEFNEEITSCGYFFASRPQRPLSDQSIRRMILFYSKLAGIEQHITPHMFRHTFATALLEADVDIRYIQELLGHSSIHITEIYTHVAMAKQRDILATKHPRNHFSI